MERGEPSRRPGPDQAGWHAGPPATPSRALCRSAPACVDALGRSSSMLRSGPVASGRRAVGVVGLDVEFPVKWQHPPHPIARPHGGGGRSASPASFPGIEPFGARRHIRSGAGLSRAVPWLQATVADAGARSSDIDRSAPRTAPGRGGARPEESRREQPSTRQRGLGELMTVSAVNRAPRPSGLADVFDVVLDEGAAIDAYARVARRGRAASSSGGGGGARRVAHRPAVTGNASMRTLGPHNVPDRGEDGRHERSAPHRLDRGGSHDVEHPGCSEP